MEKETEEMNMCAERDDKKGERFAFWRSYYKALADYPTEHQEFLWSAIIRYVYAGEQPQFERFIDKMSNLAMRSIWAAILPNLEKSIAQMGNENALSKVETNLKPNQNQVETKLKPIRRRNRLKNKEEEVEVEEDDEQIASEKEIALDERVSTHTPPKFDFLKAIVDLGVTLQTASDFMAVRKKKGAANTVTAFNQIKAEVTKAIAGGATAEECIQMAAANSWQGFNYEWYCNRRLPASDGQKAQNPQGPAPKKTFSSPEIKIAMDYDLTMETAWDVTHKIISLEDAIAAKNRKNRLSRQ